MKNFNLDFTLENLNADAIADLTSLGAITKYNFI
jgi:hypothetical protein